MADQIKSEELLYEMREFSMKTQEIAILFYDQIDRYDKEQVFCLLTDWLRNVNMMLQMQEKFIMEGKESAQIDEFIDADFIQRIFRESGHHDGEMVHECAKAVLDLILDLFYYESVN